MSASVSSRQPGHETENGKESPNLSEPYPPHLPAHRPSPGSDGKCFPREARAPSAVQLKRLDTSHVPPRSNKCPRPSRELSVGPPIMDFWFAANVPQAPGWAPSPVAWATFGDHTSLSP